MKGLKKVALVSAIAAISAGAQAELKALDDSMMGEMTGQAGLTIDVETKWTLGEFMYKDGGSLLIQNLALGGNTNENGTANIQDSYLDNLRLTIDIAGDGSTPGHVGTYGDNVLSYGFSDLIGMAQIMRAAGNTGDADINSIAGAGAFPVPNDSSRNNLMIDRPKAFGNGDLVIHSTFTDAWQKGGGFAAYANGQGLDNVGGTAGSYLKDLTFANLQNIVSRAVDFGFGFEVLGLASSGYDAGDAASIGAVGTQVSARGLGNVITKTDHISGLDTDTTTTTLISDLTINGYFGPSDFIIRNRGNGFSTVNAGGTYAWGDAVSGIETSRYFNITDLDVYIDIAGVRIEDLKIHNNRGDLTGIFTEANPLAGGAQTGTSSFGFAHGTRNIYAVKDNVLNLGRTAATNPAALVALGTGVDLTTTARADYYVDGIKLQNRFKGDIDIGHLSFGNTGDSIGELYFTDYNVHSNLTISAH
jgi:hypothetical protein